MGVAPAAGGGGQGGHVGGGDGGGGEAPAAGGGGQAFHVEVDDGGREQRQQLREQEAADDRDAERAAQLGAGPLAQRQRQAAEERRHGGHHDRAEAQQAGLADRFAGRQ